MGPVLIPVSASCFGAMAIFGKLAYAAGVPAPTLVLLRFAVASAILVTAVALVRLRSGRPALPVAAAESRRRLVVTALALGGVGYAAQASFYFASLERIDAALVALVLYTFPVLVTLASVTLGRGRDDALDAAMPGRLHRQLWTSPSRLRIASQIIRRSWPMPRLPVVYGTKAIAILKS